VIKPYLKIVANFLLGGKHAVDKVGHISLHNNEHSMTMIIFTSAIYSQWGEWECNNRWQGWTKPQKVKKHCHTLYYAWYMVVGKPVTLMKCKNDRSQGSSIVVHVSTDLFRFSGRGGVAQTQCSTVPWTSHLHVAALQSTICAHM